MKKLSTLFVGILVSICLFAQVPQGINYQAVIRDASGNIKSNEDVEISISILQGSITGTEVFIETHNTSTNLQGIISLSIGSINTESFQNIDWSNTPYYISISIDGTNIGVSQILSVPYAFYANSAGNTFSGNFNDLTNVPQNLDVDNSDDFSGDYNELLNIPVNIDTDKTDDFTGDFNDLTNVPQNLDVDNTDDFSGEYTDLANIPENIDIDVTDDFSGNFNDLINIPQDLDTNYFDDFSGEYADLANIPENIDIDVTNDFSGDFNDLINIPENLDTNYADDFDGDYNNLSNKPEFTFFWGDKDKDGFGDTYKAVYSQSAPEGYITNADDCDDENNKVYPEADEICDNLDNDCDGEIDEDAIDAATWYADNDGDGYGNIEETILSCKQPAGYVSNNTDCYDGDPEIYPGAIEIDDGMDNDCDGEIDEITTCESGANCPEGSYCIDGECKTDCSPGTQDCDGECKDIMTDTEHCGDCNVSCPPGYTCEFGSCVLNCDAGMIKCGDECIDINTDADHCGSCDVICPTGQTCENGECVSATENCSDSIDNDADGLTDCDDPDCDSNPACDASPQDLDGDGYASDVDCDDEDPTINPGASEIWYDGVDQNCDGKNDFDMDEDSYVAEMYIGEVGGTAPSSGDCDDEDPSINPGVSEVIGDGIDNDCDGEIDEGSEPETNCSDSIDNDADGLTDCDDPDCDSNPACDASPQDLDGDGYASDVDCDDEDPEINPDAIEVCDGIDNDCNGEIDDNAVDAGIWYADNDGDGYGNIAETILSCEQPAGYVNNDNDCDDENSEINPDAVEICDGIDNDCNGEVDDNAVDAGIWYADNDGDGYGNIAETILSCEQPAGYVNNDNDCDDENSEINPGASEIWYDGVDQNCNGKNDFDMDEDTYVSSNYNTEAGGTAPNNGDCDDRDSSINTGENDIPDDGIDQDCNGSDAITCYVDADQDGYGNENGLTVIATDGTCNISDSESSNNLDCDDSDSSTNPDGIEVFDHIDNDCDGEVDEGFCNNDLDCPSGSICFEGECIIETRCNNDKDCPPTHYCCDPYGMDCTLEDADCFCNPFPCMMKSSIDNQDEIELKSSEQNIFNLQLQ